MKVTYSVRIVPAERTTEAATHLIGSLAAYGCAAWPEANNLVVTLELPTDVPAPWYETWQQLVAQALAEIGLEPFDRH